MPAFEYDNNGLPSGIERVCAAPNLGAHAEKHLVEGTRAVGGRVSK